MVHECVLLPKKYPVYIAVFECKHCTQKIDNITFDIEKFNEPSIITINESFKIKIHEIYHNVDVDYIKVALSFIFGIAFGRSADRQYHNRHTSNLAGTSVENYVPVKSRAMLEFCTATISTKRTQELFYLLRITCTEHSEITKPEKLSEFITNNVFTYCKEIQLFKSYLILYTYKPT